MWLASVSLHPTPTCTSTWAEARSRTSPLSLPPTSCATRPPHNRNRFICTSMCTARHSLSLLRTLVSNPSYSSVLSHDASSSHISVTCSFTHSSTSYSTAYHCSCPPCLPVSTLLAFIKPIRYRSHIARKCPKCCGRSTRPHCGVTEPARYATCGGVPRPRVKRIK